MRARAARLSVQLLLLIGILLVSSHVSGGPASASTRVRTPIHHVVVIYQENHSFDNVLGKLCVIDARCDGTTTGLLSDGSTIALPPQPDIVPNIPHDVRAQQRDIDGGKMDGFDTLPSCSQNVGYQCFDQVDPSQIPTLAALARAFVISDRTFEDGAVPSWGSHLSLVSGTLDGFVGDEPPDIPGQHPFGPGDGCDSGLDNYWQPPGGGSPILVPSCVPKPDGTGPYRPSPVQWVPTIMDRLSAKGKSWRIYGPQPGDFSYQWSICPVFADCVYSAQDQQLVPTDQVLTDAQAGTLPRVSFVIPPMSNSQHNNASMLQGDNWIESVVSSIMNGPDWKSTAIFITYDDCGCFYDHVTPPPGLGIRVPMVIVSPYARAGYTDHQTASFASLLAFIEHNFRLHPLSSVDKNAYDYSGSFDYNQTPLPPIPLEQHPLPPAEREYLRQHPPPADST